MLAAEIRVREDGTRHAGCVESSGWVWPSARVLEASLSSSTLRGARVLDLGAGTGWLSLRLASLGAHVTATDRAPALGLLSTNVLRNQARVPGLDVETAVLEWETGATLDGSWALVVGSDLLYMWENHEPLVATLRRHAGSAAGWPLCVLAWEERKPEEEASFCVLAERAGFECEPLEVSRDPQAAKTFCLLRMRLRAAEDGAAAAATTSDAALAAPEDGHVTGPS